MMKSNKRQMGTVIGVENSRNSMNVAVKCNSSESYTQHTFPVTVKYTGCRQFDCYLFEDIQSPFDFVDVIEAFNQADNGDVVNLHVSGVGGCVSSVDALLHAMEDAQERGVRVHCICTGLVASAMTFIPLCATSFELGQGFHALLHNGSLHNGGNFNEYRASSAFYVKYMESRLRSMYEHFLSEDEIQAMLDGRDIWLCADEWCNRFIARNEKFCESVSDQEDELMDE